MKIFERVKNILLQPAKEWLVIKEEAVTIRDLYTQYALIVAAIPAVSLFLGLKLLGFDNDFISLSTALEWAIFTYVLALISVYITSFIIDILAPTFGSQKNMVASTKVAVYSSTAFWVAGISQLLPALSIFSLFGIYSLFLLFLGIDKVKEPGPDKKVIYFIVVLVVVIIVNVIASSIVTKLVFDEIWTGGLLY